MNAEDVHILRISKAALSQPGSPVLKEGSLVYGRILEHVGESRYLVSLGGHCILAFSEKKLISGAQFSASVRLDGNRVILCMSRDAEIEQNACVIPVSAENFDTGNFDTNFIQLLTALGLSVSKETVRMIQFIQELGMKISVPDIKRAISVSKEFSDSEDDAAQCSLLLSAKNLPSGKNAVSAIISQKDHHSASASDKSNYPIAVADVDVTEVYDFFSSVDTAAQENIPGLLTFFNMITGSRVKQDNQMEISHWIMLPFEWAVFDAHGVIRVLCLPAERKLKKIVVNCRVHMTNYVFVVYFKSHAISKVLYAVDKVSDTSVCNIRDDEISQLFQNGSSSAPCVTVERVPYGKLAGFCIDDVPLSIVRGSV